jgi:hypothetical protein
MSDAAVSKPLGGAPVGNKNAQKHGLFAKDAHRVDMRRRENRAVAAALRAIEDDLGGVTTLSAQEREIIANLGRRLKDLFKIDTFLDSVPTIANRRTRSLWPVALHKHVILDAIRRDLESLGLKRRTKELTFAEYMRVKDAPVTVAATETTIDTPDGDGGDAAKGPTTTMPTDGGAS